MVKGAFVGQNFGDIPNTKQTEVDDTIMFHEEIPWKFPGTLGEVAFL